MFASCLICSSKDIAPKYVNVEDYEYNTYHPVNYFICSKCGLISQLPLPNNKDIASFYPSQYRNHFMQKNGPIYAKLKKFQLWWFAKKLEFIILDKNHDKTGSILEIGCGSGELLITLKDRGFKNIFGSDILEPAKQLLLEHGIKFQKGDIVKNFPFPRKFEVIILNHVFEHLSDPVKVLKYCKNHLKKNGKAIIVMPNGDSWAMKIFKKKWDGLNAPRHFFIFSPLTMDALRQKIGFRKLHLFAMPDPLNWAISFQNVLQDIPVLKTELKNGLAWYTIFCGLMFAPLAILSKLVKKTAGMMYLLE